MRNLNRVFLAIGLVLALLVLWSSWDGEAIRAWKDAAGPAPFFVAMALLPMLGFPLTAFMLAAGAAFGVRMGIVGSLLALGANLAASYWIAQSRLRPPIVRLMKRLGYELPELETERDALRFTVVVKMTPGLPAFAKHYLLGVVGVPFVTYFVVAMLVTGAYGVALIVLGDAVLQHEIDRGLVVAALVALVPVLAWLWRRRDRGEHGSKHEGREPRSTGA